MPGLFDDLIPSGQQQPTASAGGRAIALDPRARELAIRTVLGEAADEPDEGMTGVAAVIRNRLEAGRFGKSVPEVVLARNQFEPWMTQAGRNRMQGYAPESEPYRRASAAVDAIFNATANDPTGGATHFFGPQAQAALGRRPPSWATGQPTVIGGHNFYAPEGRVMAFAAPETQARGAPAAGQGGPPPSPPAAGAISFEDLIPEGGRFAEPPAGGNFRTAREGVSERYQPVGAVEALGRGAVQGLTANFGDELAGVLAAGTAGGAPEGGVAGTLTRAARGALSLPLGRGAADVLIGAGRLGYEALTGSGQATDVYDRTVAAQRGANEQAERDQPGMTLAGNVLGGAVLPAGRALGPAASLGQRALAGARVGAGYGAAAGVGSGEDATERAIGGAAGAGLGSVIGAAAPAAISGVAAAGRGARALVSPITNTIRSIRDPEAEAARRITAGITRDAQAGAAGLTPAEFAAARAEGTPVTLMELGGETTRALARSAANTSPEARGDLTRGLEGRFGTQGERVIGWLNRTFHYPNAQAQQAAIDAIESTVNRRAYRAAELASDSANPNGVWSPELERLTSARGVREAMQEAAERGSNRAVSEGAGGFNPGVTFNGGMMQFSRGRGGAPIYPDLRFWDLTQRKLRQAADVAEARGRRDDAAELLALHRQLLNQLDAAVPEFQTARAGAARFFGAENALEAGQNFVNSRMGNREARVALARMSPEERQLFQDGFVSRYVQSLAEIPDRRNVLNQVAQSGAARERLEIALGRDKARELEGMLRIEGIMQTGNEAVRSNSTTARQLAEIGLAGGVGGYGYLASDPNAMINTALVYGAARGQRAIDSRVARQVGRMLASNDPTQLARGLRIVSRNSRFLDSLRAADQALARAGAGQGSAAGTQMIPQAAGIGRAEQDER